MLSEFKKVRVFIFDVDGVLTDGSLLLLEDGQWARRMNIKDGYALQLAIKTGYQVFVLSGSQSDAVMGRLQKLGVQHIKMSVTDKVAQIKEWQSLHHFSLEETLYMGDDIPDIAAMTIAGLPSCPSDAVDEVREKAKYVSHQSGGMGCVRDVIEKTLKLNGDWNDGTVTASI
jgi:3-deoxy-D-manno-octulosonate 8-phosphate phosphatase (KDO 8-P phosphatase)